MAKFEEDYLPAEMQEEPPEPLVIGNRDEIEAVLVHQIMAGEVDVAATNRSQDNDEFEACMALLEAERGDKEYDWMSDIRIPEFASHWLTQSSIDAQQYFQTRDFVEVYLQDGDEQGKKAADAAKELINRTLNRRDLYHYLKFIRAKGINNLVGRVYAKCWWEQETDHDIIGYEAVTETLEVDVSGNPLTSPDQIPAQRQVEQPVYGDIPVIDRFCYDIWDQRNVFTDNSYVYSLQDKRYLIFRSEMTLTELKNVAPANGYFNLDKLAKIKPPSITKFKKDATSADKEDLPSSSKAKLPYDIYERYGKYWTLVDTDENGALVYGSEQIGVDGKGDIRDGAKLLQVIITIAESEDQQTLIGFKLTPFLDAERKPYIPAIRGLCYVHLTEDAGMGDGKYTKELQLAIDDTFNISQDRVMLSTLPTIAASDRAYNDNSTLYFEPGHAINTKGVPRDEIYEFKISDNIGGSLNQIALLTQKMQQVDSIQPPSMGDMGSASTSATAFAGAYRATGERANYKSLTFENTFLCDLYWMIQNMTYVFAKPQTGFKLMGDKVYDFDPTLDYFYKPISQSVEAEYSKANKRKEWTTILGYLIQMVQLRPDVIPLINYTISEIVKLMGDEYANISKSLLNPQQPNQAENAEANVGMPMGGGVSGMPQLAMSNQSGSPQSGMEMETRAGMNRVGAPSMIGM